MRAPACIESPTRDFLEDPVQRPELLCVITALAAELRCGWALRTKSFHQLIEAIRKSRGSDNGNGRRSPRLEHIVSASATVSLITRSHDRCLVRALAMHSLCRRAGATLVFGVIAHPFTAHCWVQLGSAVLVGGYEQARLYTPILVVE